MNTNPVIKLTMVSITFNGKRKTRFVNALCLDGKPQIPYEVIGAMFNIPKGRTFTIG